MYQNFDADIGLRRMTTGSADNHVAGGTSLPPLGGPYIVDVVEIDVSQARGTRDRTLWRPLLRHDVTTFEHTCSQPLRTAG